MRTILYGYKLNDGKVQIHPVESTQVKILFELISDGTSMLAANKVVRIERTHTTIARMLKNRKYLGNEFYPRLIDESIFKKVQEVREQAIINKNRSRRNLALDKNQDVSFRFSQVYEDRYDDPFMQAAYAYNLITKEVRIDG